MVKIKFPFSVSLTQKQIDFFKRQPDAGELVRKLADSMIEAEGMAGGVKVLCLKAKLDQLKSERERIGDRIKARQEDFKPGSYGRASESAKHFKTVFDNEEYATFVENPDDPTPIDDEGRIMKKVMQGNAEALKLIEAEITRTMAEILAL